MMDAFTTPEAEVDHFQIILHDHRKNLAKVEANQRRFDFVAKLTMTLCMCSVLVAGVIAIQEAERVLKRDALIEQESLAWVK